MEIIKNLFEGFPGLWGGGVAHSVMILAIVITLGLVLGRIKLKGASLGVTWILFIGIIFAHFSLNLDVHLLHFMKEFGLILFVYSVGLQIGPGFFTSFSKGGFALNLLAFFSVLLSVAIAAALLLATDTDVPTMAGILSGAVTNTPALGAAQQAYSDLRHIDYSSILMGYAVSYPIGVIGLMLSCLFLRYVMRINKSHEENDAHRGLGRLEKMTVRPFTVRVTNESFDGVTVKDMKSLVKREYVISRMKKYDKAESDSIVDGSIVVHVGDLLHFVAAPADVEAITAFVGEMVDVDWSEYDDNLVARQMLVTRNSVNGKTIGDLSPRTNYGVNVTRVMRSGIELIPSSSLRLQVGDRITVVGSEIGLAQVERKVGNQSRKLNDPNTLPIFLGIALGCVLANVPFFIPGISQSLRLGLTGGPLVVAILIGYFGPKYHLVTYNTISANLMLREVGLCIFLACVGLSSGKDFFNIVLTEQGCRWLVCGALITIVPTVICGLIGRYVLRLNFYTLLGMLAGINTNPPVLAYARDLTSADSPSVGYSAVFPFAMFLRVVAIQLFIFILG